MSANAAHDPLETELRWLGRLLQESLRLPVYARLDGAGIGTGTAELLWQADSPWSPAYADPAEQMRAVIGADEPADVPVLRAVGFLEHYVVLPVQRGGVRQAVVVIGPAIVARPSANIAENLLNDQAVPRRDRPKWSEYWNRLPVASRMQLMQIAVLAHWSVNRTKVDVSDVLRSSFPYAIPPAVREAAERTLSDEREASRLHSGYEFERRMLGLIRSGDTAALMKLLADLSYLNAGVLSKRSQLRNIKNLAICGIALAMRAAIEGGLYAEQAYTLSDLHIQHIEELGDALAVEAALLQAMLVFADRVAQTRRDAVSRPVHACQEYIYNHLYEDLTAQRVAEAAGLTPNYLSSLFKQETGRTLMNYIQKEKIEEAKKLLEHTRDSISAIGHRLGFYDQAHFVKAFKKHAGITPGQHRSRLER
ncbi:helix-turn-helix domain-containing protein [Cohnella fermenti]|uniref:Helix-turn-helix domain-containing protein n=1 Tax=Cohnella fermenti TaxID=2565925 RepID=A0A4S4CBI0_9BACL|nr:helix-turn-helix domain-containing protein [Cohnella fermenti]THF83236.1 helix-turn-helix domain-containing protein [Cohnella fermenti]